MRIKQSPVTFSPTSGMLDGEPVVIIIRRIKDLEGVFENQAAWQALEPAQEVYRSEVYLPEQEGIPGGLCFGNTTIQPGCVGREPFMTKGHFHAQIDTAEFYWGISGEGLLLTTDLKDNHRAQKVQPGSLNYVPRGHAHRMVNTGEVPLVFGACWPSDAGHDYATIAEVGFPLKVRFENGIPVVSKTPEEK